MNEKLDELLDAFRTHEKRSRKSPVVSFLAVIGTAALLIGVVLAVYRFFSPDYLEDFEEDFDEDFEEAFEEELAKEKEEAE